MEQEEAIKLLNDNGFSTEIRNGILYAIINYKSITELNRQYKEVHKLLRNNGYNKTYGRITKVKN